MSIINQNLLLTPEGYQISRSVRLRSSASAYFNRTPTTPTNNLKWTYSCWFKRGTLGTTNYLLSGGDATYRTGLYFDSSNGIGFFHYNSSTYPFLASTSAVFRDPSAWYHIVFVFDCAQATSSNGLKLYVNGVQQTLSISSYTQNNGSTINNTYPNWIGWLTTTSSYADGYLTEVNFIDGQALTPSSFGETDAVTGVWKPKKYLGTYGTNGFYLPFNLSAVSSYAGTFNGSSQYLTVPTSANFTFGTGSFTVEAWIKTTTKTNYTCVIGQTNAAGNDGWYIETDSSGYAHFGMSGAISVQGTKDVCDGNWHHIAIVRNGSTTVTMYIDGVANVSGSDTGTGSTSNSTLGIGTLNTTYLRYFNGQLSNVRVVKGTAVYTANFTPLTAPLTAITNTQLLTLQSATVIDNSANALTISNTGTVATSVVTPFVDTIGADASGNNNTWVVNNINYTSAGATYDSMIDTPTPYADGGNGRGNYAVMNPINPSGRMPSITNGNLSLGTTGNSGDFSAGATISNSGSLLVYYEAVVDAWSGSSNVGFVGFGVTGTVIPSNVNVSGFFGVIPGTGSWLSSKNGTTTAISLSGVTAGVIISVAYNPVTGNVWFGKNGTWNNSGDPAAGTNPTLTGLTGDYTPVVNVWQDVGRQATFSVNFGQRSFAYTPPTGFKALNTQNLPDSTIKKGSQYFDATTFDGVTGGGSVVNSGGMQPDLVWMKARNNANNHELADSVRGTAYGLFSNLTNAEVSDTRVSSFNSNGFSYGTNSNSAVTGRTSVGWQWKKGATQGFDIVTGTSTGTTGTLTLAHSLGVAPSMVIAKNRDLVDNWYSWHQGLGASSGGPRIQLNQTNAVVSSTGIWGTGHTSSNALFGQQNFFSASGQRLVAYLFAEIAGFSKFGSFTGNGSTDGPFVYCGFRPRFVMIKCYDVAGEHWILYDTARNTYNVVTNELYANLSNAEGTYAPGLLDVTANGFKLRYASAPNVSGRNYIFAAFASNPFKNSLAA